MSYQRIGGVQTIEAHGNAFHEFWFDNDIDVGPVFASTELVISYDNTDGALQAEHQAVMLIRTPQNGAYQDLGVIYMVNIINSADFPVSYFLRVGRF